ncbi:hypothetical protein KEM56_005881, partial [Ascosphaera pollenicola]
MPAIAAPQPRSRPVFLNDPAYTSDRERRPGSAVSSGRSPSPFECSTPRSQPNLSSAYTLGPTSRSQSQGSKRSLLNDIDASPGTIPADAHANLSASPLPLPSSTTTLPPNANLKVELAIVVDVSEVPDLLEL